MSLNRRHNNKLPNNLPQLQNLIKRSPETYAEEFLQQYKHFTSLIEIFRLTPTQHNKKFDELVMFLAQVSACYPEQLVSFPETITEVLRSHASILDPETRMTLCRALVLLRNKKLLPAQQLLELFFTLLRCPDRPLRSFLQIHIITDIKNMNSKHKDAKTNAGLQNFMYAMLTDKNKKAAKMSIDIMIELYRKNIWNDAKTVNVIASNGCFSKITKVMVAALKFFLGTDPDEKNPDDSDSEEEPDAKAVVMANKVNKKSRKRDKQLTKVKKLVVKSQKNKSKGPVFNFSALQLVYDPQGLAEGLFKQIEKPTIERFEVKLMTLDVISRLIGLHELFLFNFYPYLQRFLQPHQREVTRILQFTAQATHELVPPDIIEPVIKTIVNNFVSERNSGDVMAIGLNAVREICARCPLAMDEDLLRDLAQYKLYKERSVMMASKSLIHLYRETYPDLLHKKDRGRPTEFQAELQSLKYGEVRAPDYVPGSEVLLKPSKKQVALDYDSDNSDWVEVDDSTDNIDIPDSDEEDESLDDEDNDSDDSDNDDEEAEGEEEEEEMSNDDDDDNKEEKDDKRNEKKSIEKDSEPKVAETNKSEELRTKQEISVERFYTDADFRRIEIAQAKKKIAPSRKRPAEETVALGDIENIYKKRKHDKATRMQTVKDGQTDRERFGYKDGRLNIHCSKTNREKRKTKNYQMVKHKARGKVKRSFQDKQISLRNHLTKQKKMK